MLSLARVTSVIVVFGLGRTMLVAERIAPGRRWPGVPGWWRRAVGVNRVQVSSVYLAFAEPADARRDR